MTITMDTQAGRTLLPGWNVSPGCDDRVLSNMEIAQRWTSWDQFKRSGMSGLKLLTGDRIGEIDTKHDQYIVMRRDTFNCLYGLASDVYRLSQTFTTVRLAAQAVLKHPKDGTILELLGNIVFQQPLLRTQPRAQYVPVEYEEGATDIDESDDSVSLTEVPPRPAFWDDAE